MVLESVLAYHLFDSVILDLELIFSVVFCIGIIAMLALPAATAAVKGNGKILS